MGETIRIEIPVTVTDETNPVLGTITGNIKKLGSEAKKTSGLLSSMLHQSKLEQAAEKLSAMSREVGDMNISVNDGASREISAIVDEAERLAGSGVEIDVGVGSSAVNELADVEDAVANLNGNEAVVGVTADDDATMQIMSADDALAGLDGDEAIVMLSADNEASQIIMEAEDAVTEFDGMEAWAELGVFDNASPVVDGARDKVEGFSGTSGSAQIGADDGASSIIDSVSDKAASWAGTAYNATIGIIDTATAPLDALLSAASNPMAQVGATLGIGFGLGDTVSTFRSFESTMSQVQAISGAVGQDFDDLTAKAKEMGATTKFTATESAEAFNYMAMAGWEPGQMIDGIDGIMNLAAASGESIGKTSDIVTDALTAFGLKAGDAGHFADVLAQASASSNTNVGLMGETFKYVAPVAGAMGYSIEDVSIAAGLMANAGLKGSMSGTALKTSIANMASPTKEMAKYMDEYGISLTDSEGNMKTLGGVMDNLRESIGGLSETDQADVASTIFGKESMAGMLAIINASEEDYEKLTEAIYNSKDAAQRMADTMLDNLDGSIALTQSAIEGMENSLGERLTPYIRSFLSAITDAVPSATAALNSLMDSVDATANRMNERMSAMPSSQDWQNADLIGKIDIAWDTLIADPFSQWIGGEGKHLISTGIADLFSNAVAILPGGQQAGLSSWLSAAVIGKGISSVSGGIQKLSTSIDGAIPGLGKYALAAGAVAAAVTAVGIAVDAYNQKQIDQSYEEHFGNVALSAQQAAEFADMLVGSKFTANIEMALGQFNNADELRKEAEAALAANDALEWKCSVGMTLSEDEKQTYSDNVQTFIDAKKSELEEQFSAITLAINTVIDDENSSSMIATVSSWFTEDRAELSRLSEKLSTEVSKALTDGIISADEQEAINALQEKINNILSSWNEAKSQTQLDMIKQKFGHLTGADLTEGTFQEIIGSYQESRETQQTELDSLSEQFYDGLNSAMNYGKISSEEAEQWKSDWRAGILSKQGGSLANALSFEENTLRDTYGSEINANIADSEAGVQKGIQNQMNPLFASEDGVDLAAFQEYLNAGVLNQMGNASGALSGLYESMAPDVNAMGDILDRYSEEFGYVPKNLKEAYDSAIEVGAAAGNEDAALQKYANTLLQNGSDELVSALTDPNNEMYEAIRTASPELGKAIDRALTETGEDIDIDDILLKLNSATVDDSEAERSVQEALDAFETSVTDSGSQIEVKEDGVMVTLGDVEVDGQSALEQISSAVGMTADELAQANGYGSAAEIEMGATITIPSENITFDTSELVNSAQEAVEQADTGTAETDASANVNYTDADTDTSEIENQVKEAVENAVENVPADGHAVITLSQENDAEKIYAQVTSEVQDKFSATIPASATVNVTLDWHILNPTASISTTDNGGSVSAHINGNIGQHASGGRVGLGGPEISWVGEEGLEYIIPTVPGRRQRGIELWEEAGQTLGVLGPGNQISAHANGGAVGWKGAYSYDSDYGENVSENSDSNVNNISSDVVSEKSGITVQVNLAPQFNISDASDSDVMKQIRSHIKELADELGNEIATMLSEAYENTPVTS